MPLPRRHERQLVAACHPATRAPVSGRGGIRSRGRRQPADGEPRREAPQGSTLGSKTTPSGDGFAVSGRGGIRTHVGVSPHDFQSCALSHSATRPNILVARQPAERTRQTIAASRRTKRAAVCPSGPTLNYAGGPRSPAEKTGFATEGRASGPKVSRGREAPGGSTPGSKPSPSGGGSTASGGGGIRTHETLSGQRLSRAPP